MFDSNKTDNNHFCGLFTAIVRPVKRDWAVLSKDTPMDISILKSVRQSVFIHLCNALHQVYLYIPEVVLTPLWEKGISN